jgi:hypothetical protein
MWAVLEREGRVLGIVAAQRPDPQRDLDDDPSATCYINSLWITPSVRGRGLGGGLVRFVMNMQYDRNQTIHHCFAWIFEQNYSAVALFEQIGFVRAKRQETLIQSPGPRNYQVKLCLRFDIDPDSMSRLRGTNSLLDDAKRYGIQYRLLGDGAFTAHDSTDPAGKSGLSVPPPAVRTDRPTRTQRGDRAGRGALRGDFESGPRIDKASGVQIGSNNVQFNYFYGSASQAEDRGATRSSESRTAGPSHRGHAFISYVREDSEQVDWLQGTLKDAGIPVWRDTVSLWPGEDWRAKIQAAISRDALVFIACFSSRSVARRKSYMNKELRLAIEQFQLRQPDDPWLIPVRFDECDIPQYRLEADRTLASLQRSDLFGPDRDLAVRRLIGAVQRLLRLATRPPRRRALIK